jgi:Tetraspanin family
MHCRACAFPQLAGLIVLGVGVWSIVDKHQFVALLATSTYALAAYTLVLAGGLVLLAGLAGCVALCRDNRCLLLVVSTKHQTHQIVNFPAPNQNIWKILVAFSNYKFLLKLSETPIKMFSRQRFLYKLFVLNNSL